MLEFDPEAHRYKFAGAPVPGVTSILASESPYRDIPPEQLETARKKGVYVHKMIELELAGTLDEESLPEWMGPALAEWRQFRKDTGFTALCSERRVYHPVYRYAGTLDLFGHLYPNSDKPQPALIDIKRSFLAGHVTGMQTAGYLSALSYCTDILPELSAARRATALGKAKRFALRVREDKRYSMVEFSDPLDRNDFLAMLAINNRRSRYAR